MTKKQLLCILLALTMMLGLLAGCGSSSDDTTEETETATAAETTEEESEEEAEEAEDTEASEEAEETEEEATEEAEDSESAEDNATVSSGTSFPLTEETQTISMWMAQPGIIQGILSPEEMGIYDEVRDLTNVEISFDIVTTETATEKFNLMISGGEYSDIIYNFGRYYTGSLEYAIDEELIMDLTDLAEDYLPNYYAALTLTEDRILSYTTANGYIAGVYSLNYDVADDDNEEVANGLVIRKDWLDELGLDIPVTYDDYYEVLTAFKNEMGATAALWMNSYGVLMNNYLVSGYGTGAYSGDGVSPFFAAEDHEVFYGPIQDSYKDYLTMMNQWYEEGLIYPDFVSVTDNMNVDNSLISTGATGLFFCSSNRYTGYYDLVEDEDFELVGLSDAVLNEGDELHIGMDESASSLTGYYVSADCENWELVLSWIDAWYTDEISFMANYGIEGVTFDYDEDGNIYFTDLILDNPDGYDSGTAKVIYIGNFFYSFSYPGINDLTRSEIEVALIEKWGETANNDWNLPANATLSDEESEEFSAIYTDIETYMVSETLKFITGSRSLDEFDDFVATIESMGIQECIDLKQSALDNYYAQTEG